MSPVFFEETKQLLPELEKANNKIPERNQYAPIQLLTKENIL